MAATFLGVAVAVGLALKWAVGDTTGPGLQETAYYTVGPRFFPATAVTLLGIFALLLLLQGLRGQRRAVLPAAVPLTRRKAARVAAILAALVLYAALMQPAGMLLTTPLFLGTMLWCCGRRSWLWWGLFPLAATGTIYIVFELVMQMPLPKGGWS